jgi:hypothetical protein
MQSFLIPAGKHEGPPEDAIENASGKKRGNRKSTQLRNITEEKNIMGGIAYLLGN